MGGDPGGETPGRMACGYEVRLRGLGRCQSRVCCLPFQWLGNRKGGAVARATGVVSELSWAQARGWRMARHHLVERAAPDELIRVVSDICGLHAQLMSSAELSLWAR